jgi:H+-translocating NAD(P) transhydrogenase subunit beta
MTVTAFFLRDDTFLDYGYIVAFSLFILGLHFLTAPRTARRGNIVAAVGMAIAIANTLL